LVYGHGKLHVPADERSGRREAQRRRVLFYNPLQLTIRPSTNGAVWRLIFRGIFCSARATVAKSAASAFLRD
jgi:hypothetical protein